MKVWFEIISELFVNLAAGWLGVVFGDMPIVVNSPSLSNIVALLFKFILAIICLLIAKYFKQKIRRRI